MENTLKPDRVGKRLVEVVTCQYYSGQQEKSGLNDGVPR